MDMRDETKAVKRAIIDAGFDAKNVQVTHGKGTSWGWLKIRVSVHHAPGCTCVEHEAAPRETCTVCNQFWRELRETIERVAIESSGRDAYMQERMYVDIRPIERKELCLKDN